MPDNASSPLEPLHTLEINPDHDEADAAVIWMHGLGATCHDFEPIIPELHLPDDLHVRFVFPQAPEQAVTLNWGMEMPSWYDVASLKGDRDFDEPGIRRSAERIRHLVDRERERGIAADRIIIAGFSQGGAMALHVGLRYPERLAGMLILSAYLLLGDKLEAERAECNADVPILQCHGLLDPMVVEGLGRASMERLRAAGYPVQYRTYGMQHEVCIEEIELIGAWLRERLCADE